MNKMKKDAHIHYVCLFSLYLGQTLTITKRNDNTVMYINSQ